MIFRGVQEWHSHPCICSWAGLQDHHLVRWPDTIIVNRLFTKNAPTVHLYCNVKSWHRKYKVVTWQLAKGKPQEPPALILGLKHMHCPPLNSGCCQFCWVLVFVHSFLSTCSKVRGAIEGRRFCFWSPANLVPCFRSYTLVTGDVPQSEMTYSS